MTQFVRSSLFVGVWCWWRSSQELTPNLSVTQHQVPSDQLIARILEFVDKDISTELKNTKSKYEKARRDYDGAVDKVTTLRGKSKLDIIKLYNVRLVQHCEC